MKHITGNEMQIINANNKKVKEKIKYQTPEILMIDCEMKVGEELREKGFDVEFGSFGRRYKIIDRYGNKKCINNNYINNIIEKDVVIIDMKQKETDETINLEDLNDLEDGIYVTTHKNQKEFNPINLSSTFYEKDFRKLRNKNSIFIVFADREIEEKYKLETLKDRYCTEREEQISNYNFLPFNINVSDNDINTTKFKILENEFSRDIFKNYKDKIYSKCTFYISSYEDENTVKLIENIYGDLIGYFQIFKNENDTISTLIVLPQCSNTFPILMNILTGFLPQFYPEIFTDFVKDTWMNKEEYMLPEIKRIVKEKEDICEEYERKIDEIEKKISEKQEENKFLYNIISSTGTGDKLVASVIKCLEYLEYIKVEDWDKVREDDEKEEDLHIYRTENDYFIAEVKGINGPAIEDDCNVIVKYKSRNCSKLRIPSIHGIVFMNYHKNVEPNQREELGFTKKEIKDAIRDEYTLVGTYQLFKSIRLCQEGIISKESIRKSLETPGIFKAIPSTFQRIGKIENILNRINVICIPLECSELKVNDDLLVVDGNNYYKTKVLSLEVNEQRIEKSKNGDKVGIKIDKDVPKSNSAEIYLII